MKLQTKKQVNRLALLFSLVYMTSYITRINYGAIISAMEASTGFSKSTLSMALTASAITYGVGQIISGVCGDRFSPKKLVTIGLSLSVLMNLAITLCASPLQMTLVWGVNGFAQAFMWPPMVRLMTVHLSDEDYKNTTVKVSWGSSFGTIFVYLISPVLLSFLNWRWVFILAALCATAMIVVWNLCCTDAKVEVKEAEKKERGKKDRLFTPLMIGIMIAIVLQGMLRDGVTTWMPSYIAETYNISNIISILTGVCLPLFSILCFQLAKGLYKKITNPLLCAGLIFGLGAISSAALYFLSGLQAGFSVFFSALLTGSMHGVNLILICMVPHYFEKSGNVSTVSGVLNSCTYVGSAIFTYGVAALSENVGWQNTLLIWLAIAVLGTGLCLALVKPWKKKFN